MQKSFIFHEGWKNVLSGLPAQVRLEVYDAIMEYGLSGTLTELKATAGLAFAVLKNDIDNDNHRAESIRRKRSEAGKRHKGNQYSSPSEQNGTNGTSVPTQWNKCSKTHLNKGVSEDSKNGTSVPNVVFQQLKEVPFCPLDEEIPPITPKEVKPHIIPQENTPHKRARVFVKPTIGEIREYCLEKGYGIDAEYFFNFYETNGWVQGKSRKPIKNWKACISTWLRNNNSYGTNSRTAYQTTTANPSDDKLVSDAIDLIGEFATER